MLGLYILPFIGDVPITGIKPLHIFECLRKVEAKGIIETAHRTLNITGQIFRYAVATGRVEMDITQALKGALQPRKGVNFPTITEPKEVTKLLRAIDGYSSTLPVLCDLRLAPLLFQRPGELRAAKWQDIDLEAQEWRYFLTKLEAKSSILSRYPAKPFRYLKHCNQ